jgi:purine-binding chemotaxis protein CheW
VQLEQPARVVCFWLAGQQFGAPIGHVKETIVLRPITRVFLTAPWLAGIINLRGDVVAVVDLAAFFDLGRCERGADARILIARSAESTATIAGLLVDRLSEVRTIELDRLQPASVLPAESGALARGIVTLDGGVPLTVLDMTELFESERLRQFQRKA